MIKTFEVKPSQVAKYQSSEFTSFESEVLCQRHLILSLSCKKEYLFSHDDHEETFSTNKYIQEFLSKNSFSCSCDSFYNEELHYCEHTAALKRHYQNISKSRLKTLIHWNNFHKKLLIYGTIPDVKECGLELVPEQGFLIKNSENLLKYFWQNPKHFTQNTVNYLKDLIEIINNPNFALDTFNVKTQLFPFQKVGVNFLVNAKRGILADEQGLGKTLQSISALQSLAELTKKPLKTLIICPSSVKTQWQREINKNIATPAVVYFSSKDLLKDLGRKFVPEITILNYELISRNKDYLDDLEYDLIILDEAQKIKNFTTKNFKAIASLKSKYLFILSGTIIENSVDDLFHIMKLINPKCLGPRWKFSFFFKESGRGVKNILNLKQKIKPYVLRRTKREVLQDLPDLTENSRYVEMLPQQRVVQDRYLKIIQNILVQNSKRELTFAEKQIIQQCFTKARLACNAPELIGVSSESSPKIDELIDLISQIDPSEKIIIFSEWVKMLDLVSKQLSPDNYVMFNGSVNSNVRQKLIDDFINNPQKRFFLSTEAGGVGLNLQKASIIINLDQSWNPAKMSQRLCRAHRLGQENRVLVYHLIAEQSLESAIEKMLIDKTKIREKVLSGDQDSEEVNLVSIFNYLAAQKI